MEQNLPFHYILLIVKLLQKKDLNGSHQIQLIPHHRAALWGHGLASHIKKVHWYNLVPC